MYSTKPVIYLAAVSAVSMSVLSLPANADPRGSSTHLLPLDDRNITVEVDSDRFESAEEEINTSTQQGEGDEPESSVLGADLLENFVDENGDVNLPLGLTVFSTMGDPSIGFGSDF
ncbi:MAG: hypothetical protein F6K42_15205 [Leptolyngbya sp. SIO1D8]|nr:hypothetical protein [Leptolyngbya sp. SIO1D8]